MKVSNSINKLCEKYGCDKAPSIGMSYTPYYDKWFKDRKDIDKLLEIGVGSYECMGRFFKDYIIGASLFVWRDYFTNAHIYGIDINKECDIKEDRMTITIADQSNKKHLEKFISEHGENWDIIIDDGSHKTEHQIFSALFFLPYLNEGGIYVIEDIREPEVIMEALKDYNCEMFRMDLTKPDDCLIKIIK